MAIDPDEPVRRTTLLEFSVGQDLSAMSRPELVARIMTLEAEISRCRGAIEERQATKSAAERFFKS